MEGFDTKDYVTLGIALYGAVLASTVFIQSLRKERRRIVVGISPTFYAYADGSLSTQMASIDVVNHGHRPVVVKAPAIRIPNGQFLSFTGAKGYGDFPKRLEDGEKASITVRYREISDRSKIGGLQRRSEDVSELPGRHWQAVLGQEVGVGHTPELEPIKRTCCTTSLDVSM